MRLLQIVLIILIYFGSLLNSVAQEKQKVFRDTLDNAFDISNYLYNLHGLLPIVAPITEPAVGYGAVGALLYFIPKKNTSGKFRMPDIVAGAGGYTSNNTWFAGGGYIGFWNEDRVRYRGIFGYGDVKLKYYGAEDSPLQNNPADFNINSYFFLQQVIVRLGQSPFFLGGKYKLSHNEVVAFENSPLPIDPRDVKLTASGLGLIAEYDKLDNFLSPSKGYLLNLSYDQNLELLGSDRNYGRVTFYGRIFIPINKTWTPSLRIETQFATGSPPFYAMPFILLRGVPAMRYQGNNTVLIETEQQINFTTRWSIVGFAGYGGTFSNREAILPGGEDKKSTQTAWNAGAGVRYLIARLLGLRMGIDIARGPEDWAVYVIFGYAWLR